MGKQKLVFQSEWPRENPFLNGPKRLPKIDGKYTHALSNLYRDGDDTM